MSTERYPAWLEVADKIAADRPGPDYVITEERLIELFHIKFPDPEMPYYKAEPLIKDARLQYVRCVENLKKTLLREHKIAIESAPGIGYRVVPTSEQTRWAAEERDRDVIKALSRSRERTQYVDRNKLTDAQRAENANELAKIATMKSQLKASTRAFAFAEHKKHKALDPATSPDNEATPTAKAVGE